MCGSYAYIGAPHDKMNGLSTGSVYAYKMAPDGSWKLSEKLFPGDTDNPADGDLFGASVSCDRNMTAVGAPSDGSLYAAGGAVYVYQRGLQAVLLVAKLTSYSGEANEQFGYSVAVSNNLVLVGAVGSSEAGASSGAVLTGGEGTTAREFFGTSVAIDAHTIVVGQPMAFDDTYETQRGAAHVFTTHTSGKALDYWAHVAILTEPLLDAVTNKFGSSVAVRQNSVLVGAP
ncbi:unnamed protein product, partial [Ectocarpus fasciculatus]